MVDHSVTLCAFTVRPVSHWRSDTPSVPTLISADCFEFHGEFRLLAQDFFQFSLKRVQAIRLFAC